MSLSTRWRLLCHLLNFIIFLYVVPKERWPGSWYHSVTSISYFAPIEDILLAITSYSDFVDNVFLDLFLICYSTSLHDVPGIYLARGNHESKSLNKIYGFEGEVKAKFNQMMVELFAEVFCCLPLAHVLNSKIFVTHGGLFSKDDVKLSDIRSIDRFIEPPDEGCFSGFIFLFPFCFKFIDLRTCIM